MDKDSRLNSEYQNHIDNSKKQDRLIELTNNVRKAVDSNLFLKTVLMNFGYYDKVLKYLPYIIYILENDEIGKSILDELNIGQ